MLIYGSLLEKNLNNTLLDFFLEFDYISVKGVKMEIASLGSEGKKKYDIITSRAEKKILSEARYLNIDEFNYEGKYKYKTIYYDTPEKLLTNAGILLYKTWIKDSYYFVIQRLNILPSTSKLKRNEIYRHAVDAQDSPIKHTFYLINGITSMFSTQFSIDLEYVIKNVKPIIIINIKAVSYKIFSGTGFKCLLTFENAVYFNKVTRKKRVNKELNVELLAPKNFLSEFDKFTLLLEKYCKDIIPKKESRFAYANRITGIIKNKTNGKVKKVDQKKI